MAVFPSSPLFRAIDFECIDPTLQDATHGGNINVRKISAPYYQCTLKWNRLKRAKFAPVDAFIEALRGRYTPFTIVLPIISAPQGSAGGTPRVTGANQTGQTLNINGCPVSVTGWLKAGDVLKLAGHNKVYKLASDANTDAAGAVTLQLTTPLMASPVDNEVLTVTDVPFTMRRVKDLQKFSLSSPDRMTFELDIREDL